MIPSIAYLGSLSLLATAAVGKEIQPDSSRSELYETGVIHQNLVSKKKVLFNQGSSRFFDANDLHQ
jgi:hypothetical protein